MVSRHPGEGKLLLWVLSWLHFAPPALGSAPSSCYHGQRSSNKVQECKTASGWSLTLKRRETAVRTLKYKRELRGKELEDKLDD